MNGNQKSLASRTWVLMALVLIEAGIIALLIANKTKVIIQPALTPVTAIRSPLELALEYESPDEKFEQLVKTHSGWIPFRSQLTDLPILAECAMLKRTNYIRILIAHGADVNEALKSLGAAGAIEDAQLLEGIANASAKK